MEEEYELVPLNPIRKIEKRVDRLEQSGISTDVIKELVEITRTNQGVIDEIVKINSEMITKVNELSGSVKGLTNQLNDFMGRLELATNEPAVEEAKPQVDIKKMNELENRVNQRLEKLEKKINTMLLSTIAKPKRLPPRLAGFQQPRV
jgi:HAMP domain-containing protein